MSFSPQDGDRFWKMPECFIRGSTIKYLRIPDEVSSGHDVHISSSKFLVMVVIPARFVIALYYTTVREFGRVVNENLPFSMPEISLSLSFDTPL